MGSCACKHPPAREEEQKLEVESVVGYHDEVHDTVAETCIYETSPQTKRQLKPHEYEEQIRELNDHIMNLEHINKIKDKTILILEDDKRRLEQKVGEYNEELQAMVQKSKFTKEDRDKITEYMNKDISMPTPPLLSSPPDDEGDSSSRVQQIPKMKTHYPRFANLQEINSTLEDRIAISKRQNDEKTVEIFKLQLEMKEKMEEYSNYQFSTENRLAELTQKMSLQDDQFEAQQRRIISEKETGDEKGQKLIKTVSERNLKESNENSKKTNEHAELSVKLLNAKKEIQNLRAKKKNLSKSGKEKAEELEIKIKSYEDSLKNQEKELTAHVGNIEHLEVENSKLAEMAKENDTKLLKMEIELNKTKQDGESKIANIMKNNAKLTNVKEAHNKLEDQLLESQKQHKERSDELLNLKLELKDKTEELETYQNVNEGKLKDISAKLDAHKQTHEDHKIANEDKIFKLENKHKDLHKEKDLEIHKLKGKINDYNERHVDIHEQHSKKVEKIENLNKQLKDAKKEYMVLHEEKMNIEFVKSAEVSEQAKSHENILRKKGTEIESHKGNVKSLETEKLRLNKIIEEKDKRLGEMEKHLNLTKVEKDEEINILKANIQDYSDRHTNIHGQHTQKVGEIAELNMQLQDARKEYLALHEEKMNLELAKSTELEERNKSHENILKSKVFEIETHKEKVNSLEDEKTKLNQIIEEKELKVEELEKHLNLTKEDREEKSVQILKDNAKVKNMEETNSALEDRFIVSQKQNVEKTEEILNLQMWQKDKSEEFHNYQKNTEKSISFLQSKIEDLEQVNENYSRENEHQKTQFELEHKKVADEKKDMENEVERLHKSISDYTVKHSTAKNENNQKLGKISELSTEIEERKRENFKLQEEKNSLEYNSTRKHKELASKVDSQENELVYMEEELRTERGRVKALESEKTEQGEELETHKQRYYVVCNELKQQKEDGERYVHNLQGEHDKEKERMHRSAQEERMGVETTYIGRVEALNAKISRKKGKYQRLSEVCDARGRELGEVEGKLDEYEKDKSELLTLCEEGKNQKQREIDVKEDNMKELRDQVREMERVEISKNALYKKSEQEISELGKQLEERNNEVVTQTGIISELQAKYTQSEQLCGKKQQEIELVQYDLAEAEDELTTARISNKRELSVQAEKILSLEKILENDKIVKGKEMDSAKGETKSLLMKNDNLIKEIEEQNQFIQKLSEQLHFQETEQSERQKTEKELSLLQSINGNIQKENGYLVDTTEKQGEVIKNMAIELQNVEKSLETLSTGIGIGDSGNSGDDPPDINSMTSRIFNEDIKVYIHDIHSQLEIGKKYSSKYKSLEQETEQLKLSQAYKEEVEKEHKKKGEEGLGEQEERHNQEKQLHREEIKELENIIKGMGVNIESKQSEIDERKRVIDRIMGEIKDLGGTIREKDKVIEGLKAGGGGVQTLAPELQRQFEQRKINNEELKRELGLLKEEKWKLEVFSENREKVISELQEASDNSVSEFLKSTKSLKHDINRLRKEVKEKGFKLYQIEQENIIYKSNIPIGEQELVSKVAGKSTDIERKVSTIREKDEYIKELREECHKLTLDISKHKTESDNYSKRCDALTKEINKAHTDLHALQVQLKIILGGAGTPKGTPKGSHSTPKGVINTDYSDMIKRLSAKATDKEIAYEQLENKYNITKNENVELKYKVEDLKSITFDLENEIKTRELLIVKMKKDIDALQSELHNLDQDYVELTTANNTNIEKLKIVTTNSEKLEKQNKIYQESGQITDSEYSKKLIDNAEELQEKIQETKKLQKIMVVMEKVITEKEGENTELKEQIKMASMIKGYIRDNLLELLTTAGLGEEHSIDENEQFDFDYIIQQLKTFLHAHSQTASETGSSPRYIDRQATQSSRKLLKTFIEKCPLEYIYTYIYIYIYSLRDAEILLPDVLKVMNFTEEEIKVMKLSRLHQKKANVKRMASARKVI